MGEIARSLAGGYLQADPRQSALAKMLDPEIARRSALIPIGRTKGGGVTAAAPEFLVEMLNSAMLPGAAAQGYQATPQDAAQFGLDWMAGGMGVNALGKGAPRGAVLGANVWQGGPHKYGPEGAAKSLDHVGKGEGATAYGWGRYDAGAKEVADQYRINLAYNPDEMKVGGQQINKLYDDISNKAARMPAGKAGVEYEKMELLERLMQHEPVDDIAKYAAENLSPDASAWVDNVIKKDFQTFGHLYKHDLPDEDIARYLDWDKPLSEQPESVRAALANLPDLAARRELMLARPHIYTRPVDEIMDNLTGREVYDILEESAGSLDWPVGSDLATRQAFRGDAKQAASEALGAAGIPGLKYFDGNNRGMPYKLQLMHKGKPYGEPMDAHSSQVQGLVDDYKAKGFDVDVREGSRNYVTWDQDVLNRMKLLERNGETFSANAPAAAPYALAATLSQGQPAALSFEEMLRRGLIKPGEI